MQLKVYGNREAVELVRRMVVKDREQRSIIIHGDSGLGKKHLASYIAASYLCSEHNGQPCGVCKSCRMIMHGTHPDVIYVRANPNGNYIIDESIRPIVADSAVMPNESRYKVYIIPDIDRSVNTIIAVQNILLKLIEEPPEHVVVIMTARSKEVFLQTIISRTLSVGVSAVSEQESVEYLTENFPQAAKQDIDSAVQAGRGNIGRCRQYLENGSFHDAVDIARGICDGLITASEYGVLKAVFAADGKKQLARQAAELFSEIARDAASCCVGNSLKELTVSCYEQGARRLSAMLSSAGCSRLYDTAIDCVGRIDANCNLSLTLSYFAAKLSQVVK